MAWAIEFDGVNDEMSMANVSSPGVDFTLEFDLLIDPVGNYCHVLNSSGFDYVRIGRNGVNERLIFRSGGVAHIIESNVSANVNTNDGLFHKHLITYDGADLVYSIDGFSVGTATVSTSYTGFVRIGRGAFDYSPQQIKTITYVDLDDSGNNRSYDATSSNHGSGTPILDDISGNNNDATGVNMPTDGSAWIDLGGGGISVTVTETLNSFADSSVIDIDHNVTFTVTETLSAFADNSILAVTSVGEVAVSVTEVLSSFLDSSVINLSANIDVTVTEVLNSFLDGSNVTIAKDITIEVTEVLASFTDNSFIKLPAVWTNKPAVITNYTVKTPVITIWTDKG